MAVYVTDTHPLLWYATEAYRQLSPNALRVFQQASRGAALVWVPAMAIWEAGMLERMQRIQLKPSFRKWAAALTAQPGFAFAPLDADAVDSALSVQLSLDVFDMGILATARAKDVPLITKDGVITASKTVEILW